MSDAAATGRRSMAGDGQTMPRARATAVDTRPTETRRAFKTSEFWVFILIAAGVIVATYTDDNDSLTEWRGWLLFCAAGIAYIVSRGLAKAGSSEPRVERVDLD
jgi:predicted nicotinamide N-methyase